MFAVLDKTENIIYESNIVFRFLVKFPEIFWKFSGKYFSGTLTSLIIIVYLATYLAEYEVLTGKTNPNTWSSMGDRFSLYVEWEKDVSYQLSKYKMVAATILNFGHYIFGLTDCSKSNLQHFYPIWRVKLVK